MPEVQEEPDDLSSKTRIAVRITLRVKSGPRVRMLIELRV